MTSSEFPTGDLPNTIHVDEKGNEIPKYLAIPRHKPARQLAVTFRTDSSATFQTVYHLYSGGTDSEALHEFLCLNDPGDEYTATFSNFKGEYIPDINWDS